MLLLFFLMLNLYVSLVVFSMWYYLLILGTLILFFCFFLYDRILIINSNSYLSGILKWLRFEKIMEVLSLRASNLFFIFDANEIDILTSSVSTFNSMYLYAWSGKLFSFFIWW